MDMLGRRGILPSSRGDARNPAFLAAVSLIRSSMRPGVLSPPVLILPHSMEPSLWSMVPTTVSGETSFCVREGNGTPLQYSCLENPMDGGAWWAAIHGVAKSRTQLSDFTFTFHFHALQKEMATHSSALVWRIPGTGEPGGLPSMGSHRVGHD